ncbi:cysteine desulfurase family protein [Leucobacter iarius]|uniref:Cysteine desulfurase family protein n=1 Tax=Leucobacter iarius TaxID=333963 RepID=A0ABN2L9Z2_9MICO
MLYADHAATAPIRPEVLDAMRPALTGAFGNPSSHHTAGEAAAALLEDARRRVARVLGARTGDVVFTSGGTEANNLALKGIALGSGTDRVLTTPIEHESILASVDYLERFHGVRGTRIPVDPTGRLEPEALDAALEAALAAGDERVLVSFAHANNEVGTVQDAAALVAVARQRGAIVHVDAVQSAGWLALDGLGADAVSIAGHKLGAPKGIGALAVRGRVPIEPLVHGGGQERGRRSGTENVAGAIGLATALELGEAEREAVVARVGDATARFAAEVLRLVPSARATGDLAFGDPARRLPATASFTLAGASGESVLLELERRGVVSSSGSACAAGSDEPSHVLLACGIDPAVAQTAIRFTFGRAPIAHPEGLASLVAASVAAVVGP